MCSLFLARNQKHAQINVSVARLACVRVGVTQSTKPSPNFCFLFLKETFAPNP